ncbi:MAG: hypothetical protein ACXVKN_02930 [Acidimicrobiia bacterium]
MLVGPWHEPMTPPERGTRVEVRLLEDEPKRGSRFAAERVVIDRPVFRADLFDQTDKPPGNLRAAHFHPGFDGIEPLDRHWDEAIQRDATGWLAAELADLPGLLKRAGVEVADAPWLEADTAALREVVPTILAAVEATWAQVRAE